MLLSARSGVGIRVEASGFHLLQTVHNGCQTHTALCTERINVLLGVKPSWREVDHLDSSSSEVMNEWSHTSTPSVGLYVVDYILVYNIKY